MENITGIRPVHTGMRQRSNKLLRLMTTPPRLCDVCQLTESYFDVWTTTLFRNNLTVSPLLNLTWDLENYIDSNSNKSSHDSHSYG